MLAAGLTAIAASIVLMVLLVAREGRQATGVASALESIEKVYAGKTVAAQEASGRARLLLPLLRLTRRLALRLSPDGTIARLQTRLDMAGNPGWWTPERLLSYKGLGLSSAPRSAPSSATAASAACWPSRRSARPPDSSSRTCSSTTPGSAARPRSGPLPDVLDLLVVSVEAGLGFDAALDRVARNIDGPLAGELSRVMQEMQIGMSREDALRGLAQRTSVDELKSFVAALVQASDLGIPIGKVLREQGKEMRIKRRQLAEETAQKLPVKITFPVMICIMPALFIVVLGPGVLGIMRTGVFG